MAFVLGAAGCGADGVTTATGNGAEIDAAVAEVVATEDAGTLFAATASGVAAIDSTGGEVEWSLAPAVPSPDWATLVTATTTTSDGDGNGGTTTVRAVSSTDQRERWTAEVEGTFEIRQVATGGDAAVLLPPAPPTGTGTLPVAGRQRTTMSVVRSDGSERRFELEGNLEPEAFAADASGIFVVQYTPAVAPERYRVRWLDLESGEVTDAVDRHGVFQADMPGLARTQVRSPDGQRLYTYYAVPPSAATSQPAYAFVHVLDLREGWAHCIDLPAPWGAGSQAAIGIATSPDGDDLWLTDRELGTVALVDTTDLTVARTADIEPVLPDSTIAAAGPDGHLYVATGPDVTVLGRDHLVVEDQWTTDAYVSGIDISPDGDEVFVSRFPSVNDGSTTVDVFDARRGELLRTLSPDLPEPITSLGRERTPLPYGTKECAC